MEAKATETGLQMWAILELMGHRRLAGLVTEAQIAGAGFIRIDIPKPEGNVTQFYSGQSVYSLTPTTEEIARAVAKDIVDVPVNPWELRHLSLPEPQRYANPSQDPEE